LGYITSATSTCLVNLLNLVAVQLGLLDMRSIVIIAVVIALTISRSVHCQQKKALVTFDITYRTLEDQLGVQRTPDFLNAICQQPPSRDGSVRGAISFAKDRKNIQWMIWGDYMKRSSGILGTPGNNYAYKGWDTFRVKCGLVASSTWANNVPVQSSPWVQNAADEESMHEVPVSVTVSPFRCDSNIPVWKSLLEKPLPHLTLAPTILGQLSGLPDYHRDQWVGTVFSTAANDEFRAQMWIQGHHQAQVSVTMVERTVEAYLAIEVVQYFFGKGNRPSAPTWRGEEGMDHIYTKGAGTIECTAICNFLPHTWIQFTPRQERL
jgi:hypothetical protein